MLFLIWGRLGLVNIQVMFIFSGLWWPLPLKRWSLGSSSVVSIRILSRITPTKLVVHSFDLLSFPHDLGCQVISRIIVWISHWVLVRFLISIRRLHPRKRLNIRIRCDLRLITLYSLLNLLWIKNELKLFLAQHINKLFCFHVTLAIRKYLISKIILIKLCDIFILFPYHLPNIFLFDLVNSYHLRKVLCTLTLVEQVTLVEVALGSKIIMHAIDPPQKIALKCFLHFLLHFRILFVQIDWVIE